MLAKIPVAAVSTIYCKDDATHFFPGSCAAVQDKGGANVEASRQTGCHIVQVSSPWIYGASTFTSLRIPIAQARDMLVDPKKKLLSLLNTSMTHRRSFVISVMHPCVDRCGAILSDATSMDDAGIPPTTIKPFLLTSNSADITTPLTSLSPSFAQHSP